MTIAYLNGTFLPIDEAKISPLDRGFLFGDGIYEVIPSFNGQLVGGGLHERRMNSGLAEIGIVFPAQSNTGWSDIAQQLESRNQQQLGDNIGIYLHVSRGTDSKRFHAFPTGVTPTVFAYAFAIPASKSPDKNTITPLRAVTQNDLRWRRCHIKSTSLLGNVLHFQQGQTDGVSETILYNADNQITEASAANVFIVKNGNIITPPLDNQILPGITRHILIESIRRDNQQPIIEQRFSLDELYDADEVWITSSSKEVAPVTSVDGQRIGTGEVGDAWEQASKSYHKHKFTF